MKKRKKIFGIIFKQINKVEEEFLQLNNITATMNQVILISYFKKIIRSCSVLLFENIEHLPTIANNEVLNII